MQASRETELLNAIGLQLREIMPESAIAITADGEGADDWADVSFRFVDANGTVGHFSMQENPAEASDEISEALMELHQLMAKTGKGAWTRAEVTVDKGGELDVSFAYEDA